MSVSSRPFSISNPPPIAERYLPLHSRPLGPSSPAVTVLPTSGLPPAIRFPARTCTTHHKAPGFFGSQVLQTVSESRRRATEPEARHMTLAPLRRLRQQTPTFDISYSRTALTYNTNNPSTLFFSLGWMRWRRNRPSSSPICLSIYPLDPVMHQPVP